MPLMPRLLNDRGCRELSARAARGADRSHAGTAGGMSREATRWMALATCAILRPTGSPRLLRNDGISVLRGRGITEQDREGALRVVVLTETGARDLFGGEDPHHGKQWTRGVEPARFFGYKTSLRPV
jgi:hypothetical protein